MKNDIMNKLINDEITIDSIQNMFDTCPFCGDKLEVWEADIKGFVCTRCDNPNCWAGASEVTGTPDILIEAWNKRVRRDC